MIHPLHPRRSEAEGGPDPAPPGAGEPAPSVHGMSFGVNWDRVPAACLRPFTRQETRQSRRIRERELSHLPMSLSLADGPFTAVTCLDLSMGGFRVACRQAAGLPAVLGAGRLRLPDSRGGRLELPVRVQWSRPRGGGWEAGLSRGDGEVFEEGSLDREPDPMAWEAGAPAWVEHPYLYREWFPARIRAWQPDGRLTLAVDDPEAFLLAGDGVRWRFSETSLQPQPSYLRIVRWARGDKHRLQVDAVGDAPSSLLLQEFGRQAEAAAARVEARRAPAIPWPSSASESLGLKRRAVRIVLPPSHRLDGQLELPFGSNRWYSVRCHDLNGRMGFRLIAHATQAVSPLPPALEPGTMAGLRLSLPGFESRCALARLAWMDELETVGPWQCGVETLDLPYPLYQRLCRHLLASPTLTPKMLMTAGFPLNTLKDGLRFRCAHSLEDYAQVLRLRRDTLAEAGHLPHDAAPESQALPEDGRSRLLTAWHGSRLVGAVALAFPLARGEGPGDTLGWADAESEAGGPEETEPDGPAVEIGGLCLAPDYRGTDVLQGLFEHAMKAFLLSDREKLVLPARAAWAAPLRRMGFRKMARRLGRDGLLPLLVLERKTLLRATGIHPFVWNLVMGGAVEWMARRGMLELTRGEKLRIRLLRSLAPLARRWAEWEVKQAFQRHLALLREAGPVDSP